MRNRSKPGGKGVARTGVAADGGLPNTWVNGYVAHVRERWVRCGKAPKCRSCPHGPYLYQVWRDKDGRVHEKYLGRGELPKRASSSRRGRRRRWRRQ